MKQVMSSVILLIFVGYYYF